MEITEVSVIRVAREWAAKNDQDDAQAVIDAADAIGKIRYRFTGDGRSLPLTTGSKRLKVLLLLRAKARSSNCLW